VKGGYELSDEGVRSYILNRGGRISIKEIIEIFKPAMKAYTKAHQARTGVVEKGSNVGRSR
jgi:hypothetical protein